MTRSHAVKQSRIGEHLEFRCECFRNCFRGSLLPFGEMTGSIVVRENLKLGRVIGDQLWQAEASTHPGYPLGVLVVALSRRGRS